MKWFRRRIKIGSRLALFALAIQFALSFAHFHVEPAHARPAMQIGLGEVRLSPVDDFVLAEAAGEVSRQRPTRPDTGHHPAENCAICAIITLAGNLTFPTPPVLPLPEASDLSYLVVVTEPAHLDFGRLPFQSRAPPAS